MFYFELLCFTKYIPSPWLIVSALFGLRYHRLQLFLVFSWMKPCCAVLCCRVTPCGQTSSWILVTAQPCHTPTWAGPKRGSNTTTSLQEYSVSRRWPRTRWVTTPQRCSCTSRVSVQTLKHTVVCMCSTGEQFFHTLIAQGQFKCLWMSHDRHATAYYSCRIHIRKMCR